MKIPIFYKEYTVLGKIHHDHYAILPYGVYHRTLKPTAEENLVMAREVTTRPLSDKELVQNENKLIDILDTLEFLH